MGGFPPTLEQARLTLAGLQNWKLENRNWKLEVVKKSKIPVMLSEAKNLQLFVFKKKMQMLRFAQHDSLFFHSFLVPFFIGRSAFMTAIFQFPFSIFETSAPRIPPC